MCSTTPNYFLSSFFTLRTLTFSLHIFLAHSNHLEVFFLFESLFTVYLSFSDHMNLKPWLCWLDPVHFLAFQTHGRGTTGVFYCHNSMAFQGPCQQASWSILLTDHTQSDCLPERVRDCPGRTVQKAGILKQRSFFLLWLKTEKHAFSF